MELKTNERRRKQILRPIRAVFLGVTLGLPVLGILLLKVLPRSLYYQNFLGCFLAFCVFSFIPSLIILGLYYADCSGTSLVQKLYLYPDKLVYSGYSGQGYQQIRYLSVIDSIDSYHVGKWKIRLNGKLTFTYTGKWEHTKVKTHLNIMRTLDNEKELLALLDRLQAIRKENLSC